MEIQQQLVDDEAATPARVGKEGTTARIHPVDTFWIHGPTAADFAAQNRIDLPKIYDDAEDEDFSSGLVASWTVTSGVVGTVDLLGTSLESTTHLHIRQTAHSNRFFYSCLYASDLYSPRQP